MAKNPTAKARVLSDNTSLGILCGQIVEGPEKAIKALAAAGAVDDNAEAVAYAGTQGAAVVALEDPAAAVDLAAAVIESKDADAAATTSIVAS